MNLFINGSEKNEGFLHVTHRGTTPTHDSCHIEKIVQRAKKPRSMIYRQEDGGSRDILFRHRVCREHHETLRNRGNVTLTVRCNFCLASRSMRHRDESALFSNLFFCSATITEKLASLSTSTRVFAVGASAHIQADEQQKKSC